jgi:dipeptidyl aminopeptidase/acylaminoacyl peptidase
MPRRTLRRGAALAALTAGAALALAPSALATFPGDNGLIAFSRDGDIWTIHPDGTGEKRLTSGAEHNDFAPEWSADGHEIFFTRQGAEEPHIYRMNADGSGTTHVTAGEGPQISPDGMRLAFSTGTDFWVARRDGSDRRLVIADDNLLRVDDWGPTHDQILHTFRDGDALFAGRSPAGAISYWSFLHDEALHFSNAEPSWSPSGTRIAFSTYVEGISAICFGEPVCDHPTVGIRLMDLGGGGLRTVHQGSGRQPVWSPDGTAIAFVDGLRSDPIMRVIGADGTGLQTLGKGSDPDWQPVEHVQIPPDPPVPPEPEIKTVTVTVHVPPPPPVVLEKVVTKVVTIDGKVCPIPKAKRRLTLTIRTTRAIRRGASVKVRLDVSSGRVKVDVPKGRPVRVTAR